jgi:hypothetical protein
MSNILKKALYVCIGEYIGSVNNDVTRKKLNEIFSDTNASHLSRALANACKHQLIHVAAHNVYRAGPRPVSTNIVRIINLDEDDDPPPDTEALVQQAILKRPLLEFAWIGVRSPKATAHHP